MCVPLWNSLTVCVKVALVFEELKGCVVPTVHVTQDGLWTLTVRVNVFDCDIATVFSAEK